MLQAVQVQMQATAVHDGASTGLRLAARGGAQCEPCKQGRDVCLALQCTAPIRPARLETPNGARNSKPVRSRAAGRPCAAKDIHMGTPSRARHGSHPYPATRPPVRVAVLWGDVCPPSLFAPTPPSPPALAARPAPHHVAGEAVAIGALLPDAAASGRPPLAAEAAAADDDDAREAPRLACAYCPWLRDHVVADVQERQGSEAGGGEVGMDEAAVALVHARDLHWIAARHKAGRHVRCQVSRAPEVSILPLRPQPNPPNPHDRQPVRPFMQGGRRTAAHLYTGAWPSRRSSASPCGGMTMVAEGLETRGSPWA